MNSWIVLPTPAVYPHILAVSVAKDAGAISKLDALGDHGTGRRGTHTWHASPAIVPARRRASGSCCYHGAQIMLVLQRTACRDTLMKSI